MNVLRSCSCVRLGALLLSVASTVRLGGFAQAQEAGVPQKTAPAVGTIKAIAGKTLTLKTDLGTEINVQFPADVKVLRVPPGSKTLKDATAIQLTDLEVGDRILVRGEAGTQPNTLTATTIVAMKKEDIAKKQSTEREEWQRRGIGGLVKSVEADKEKVVVSTMGAAGAKDVLIHAPVGTILRRYAPDSVNFDDAKIAPLSEIKAGDQLRARGSRSADGTEFTADEIVSGTFHNIAGTIASIDPSKATLTVADLATKRNVELSVTSGSQLRKLPQPVAQRIAMRLKGGGPDVNLASGAPGAAAPAAAAGQGGGPGQGPSGPNVGSGGRSGGDLQQMLTRLPVSPLGDFQKGDAVMIVATAGSSGTRPTVITLLGGVDPILQSAPQGQAASILSPWSLSSGGGADTGTP